MEFINELITFISEHLDVIGVQTLEHIGLTFVAIFLAILVGIPVGLWLTRHPRYASPVLNVTGIVQTVPSLALLAFMVPLIGIGPKAAIVALFLYALLPIVQNTYTGIREIPDAVKEAGRGMGMNDWQLLQKIEIPLALKVIFAGIRTSTIINIGFATLAALIAAGGLGSYIFDGIALNNSKMILAGALPAALLALLLDTGLASIQNLRLKTMAHIGSGFFLLVMVSGSVFLIYFPDLTQSFVNPIISDTTSFFNDLGSDLRYAILHINEAGGYLKTQWNATQQFLSELKTFMVARSPAIAQQTAEHIGLTFTALFLALLAGIPLGIWAHLKKRGAPFILKGVGVFQTIPSIAVLGFMIPLLGIGTQPAIMALFLYALLPIVQNTYSGLQEVSTSVREAGRGMGMSRWQLLGKVELLLALPYIFAGIRTAAIINIGVATLAAFIASGGLGEFIFGGLALNDSKMILAGALPAAALALLFDLLLRQLQKVSLHRMKWVFGGGTLLMTLVTLFMLLPTPFQSPLKAGFSYEFVGRDDGYPALQKSYDLHVDRAIMQPSLMYDAVYQKKVDVISGYSTDGRIKSYDLAVLEDDQQAFPPYHCAPIIRTEVLHQYPVLDTIFQKLAGRIDNATMRHLNFLVDQQNRSARDVAQHFLDSIGLYHPSQKGQRGPLTIGSKLFTEQYILAHLFQLMIEGHSAIKTKLATGIGGSKLCFESMQAGEIDLYPEYTGSGLVVMLNTPSRIRDSLGQNQEAVYDYVAQQYKKRFGITWLPPLGFNNTYALMMRQQQARQLNIETVSDLKAYLDKAGR
jgi:osmoprotectant transport system permease protein